MSAEEITFGLVHGAYHGAWCWQFLQDELTERGYRSVAMDLPIDSPSATFDDYADVVVDSLREEENVVLVGHSRAGNIIPRVPRRRPIQRLIYLCASFDEATLRSFPSEILDAAPRRVNQVFEAGIRSIGDELTVFDEDAARKTLLSDCSPSQQYWAINQFRAQRRSELEPPLEAWPSNIPQDFIYCQDDQVIEPDWSKFIAKNVLQLRPRKLRGGHSPFITQPRKLARTLTRLAA